MPLLHMNVWFPSVSYLIAHQLCVFACERGVCHRAVCPRVCHLLVSYRTRLYFRAADVTTSEDEIRNWKEKTHSRNNDRLFV